MSPLPPLRVCFLCHEYPPGPHGGLGTLTQVLGRALVRAGHEVRVVGVYPRGHSAPHFELDEGVRVWRLPGALHRPGRVWSRLHLYRTVAGWCRERHIDIVEAPDWEGWIAGWPRLPVPVIMRLNGSATYFALELGEAACTATSFLERASFRRADYWCAASRYVAEKTRRLSRSATPPPVILHNPIDRLAPLSPSAPVGRQVMFAGTLTAKKGVVSLLRAWPIVAARFPDAELHLYGRDGLTESGGSMRAFLHSMLADPFQQRVHFHGHVARESLADAFGRARVAVFPSYAEAFAFTPMEAMASGCPTIYSRRGSGPELIEHGYDGLLIDPDDPQDIAVAILRLLSDYDLADRLGRAGRRRIEDSFSIDLLGPLNEAFYRDCTIAFCGRELDPSV